MNITTWNMQGSKPDTELKWSTGVLNLLQAPETWRPDVMCLQESGGVPDSAVLIANIPFALPGIGDDYVQLYSWAGSSKRPAYYILFHNWDVEGNRVNTAIVLDTEPAPADVMLMMPDGGPAWRPTLGVKHAGTWIFSFHAISGGGADAAGILEAVAGGTGGNPWIIGADWNREPETLAIPAGSVICPPIYPTYPVSSPRSKYDYCVRSGADEVVGTVVGLVMSDHYPDAFIF